MLQIHAFHLTAFSYFKDKKANKSYKVQIVFRMKYPLERMLRIRI